MVFSFKGLDEESWCLACVYKDRTMDVLSYEGEVPEWCKAVSKEIAFVMVNKEKISVDVFNDYLGPCLGAASPEDTLNVLELSVDPSAGTKAWIVMPKVAQVPDEVH